MQTEPPPARTWEQLCEDEAALWGSRLELPDLELAGYGVSTWRLAAQKPFRFGTLLVDRPDGVRVLSFKIGDAEQLIGPKVPIEMLGPTQSRGLWIATLPQTVNVTIDVQNVGKAARVVRGVLFGNYVT